MRYTNQAAVQGTEIHGDSTVRRTYDITRVIRELLVGGCSNSPDPGAPVLK